MNSELPDYFSAHAKVVDESLRSLQSAADVAGDAIVQSLESGGKVICFGNGGSATQSSHMAQELTGRFSAIRKPLPAISLSADGATVTCISNDFGYESLFERQIEAFAEPGDVALALTTSGRSQNVLKGVQAAKAKGAITIALTGKSGLAGAGVDHLLAVPSEVTSFIQEIHLMLLHFWCRRIDRQFAP